MLNSTFRKLVKDLPPDATEAIIEFRNRVSSWQKSPEEHDDGDTLRYIVIFYKNAVPKVFPRIIEDENFSKLHMADQLEWYHIKIDGLIESMSDRLLEEEIRTITDRFDLDSGESFGLARLNGDEKHKIHGNIRKIREIIEVSFTSERKKNALFQRLTDLSAEVDLHGTKTDRFFAFMSDAAFAVSDMTKNAKPFLDEVKDMVKTVGRSRARQEGVSLPPGDEVLQLPPPSLKG